jgi:hypothetical protein
LLLALASVFAVVAALGPAVAQEQDGASAGGLRLPLFAPLGGDTGEGTLQGSVSDLEFSDESGELMLSGLVNGIISIGDDTIRVTDEPFETPVEPWVAGAEEAEAGDDGEDADEADEDEEASSFVGAGRFLQDNPTQPEPDEGKCDILFLDIQPITLNLLGLEVLTSRITVDANAIPGEGNLAGNLLCSLAGLLDGLPETLGDVTDQLNDIVDEAGAATEDVTEGRGSLPLFGTLEDVNGVPGTFYGSITDVVFSDDGGAVIGGILNGVIVDENGNVIRVDNQEITTPVTPSVGGTNPGGQNGNQGNQGNQGNTQPTATTQAQPTPTTDASNPTQPEPDPGKCDVLYLDIQPITLNLLGLEVLTSRITVDVNAIPGEGNLAGNLVCALAGLLDGTPDAIAEITDQLNDIMDEIGVSEAAAVDEEVTPEAEATEEGEGTAAEPTAEGDGTGEEPTAPATEQTAPPAEPTAPPAEPTAPPAEPTVAPAEPTPAA